MFRPLLVTHNLLKTGGGLKKILTNTRIEYIYWDDPHELQDRSKVLFGEINVGNTNPNIYNEIINILEEIRENDGLQRKKKTKISRKHARKGRKRYHK